jgi:hypothetical protein
MNACAAERPFCGIQHKTTETNMKTPKEISHKRSIGVDYLKKIIAALAMAATVGLAQAQTTNLFPNGDFSNGGPTADWVENNGGGSYVYSYPSSGGNPGGYGIIDNTGGGGYGIWVGGNVTPISLDSMGLTAGTPYTFVMDMKIISGSSIGGLKIESWNNGGYMSDSGDMRPVSGTGNWVTYSFNYTPAVGAVGLKIVPLWGPNSSVGYDNIGVIVPLTSPLTTTITSPANAATVSPNFTITATASVLPGSVTNVYFYDGATLLGNADTSPYSFNVTGASLGAHALKVVAKADTGASATSSVVNVTVATSTTVLVDPSKPWQGFMNVFQLPQNGGGYVFGQAWGTADLSATFSGSTLTLAPNTVADPAAFWYVTTNSPSVGNKSCDASMYVQPAGSLPGLTVTFTGTCNANTMVGGSITNPAGNGWTCVAFVKDLASDFSSSVVSSVALTNGQVFSVSLNTINDPARHVQYGFETIGPCVWAGDPVLASYGNVQVGPLVTVAPTLNVSKAGNVLTFTWSDATYHLQSQTNSISVGLSSNWVDYPGGGVSGVTATISPANPTVLYRLKKP